jgi:beta-xylosidase
MALGTRLAGLVAGIMLIVGGLAGEAAAESAAPAYPGDFPDPSVIVAGGYFAYATGHGSNLQVISSPDLHTWSPPSDPLPRLPAWASQPWTWAPGVIRRGSTYLMYYTAHHKAWNQQCISVATSASPAGPFTDNSSAPLLCQRSRGGSIDPQPFLAPNGALYLLWKSEAPR